MPDAKLNTLEVTAGHHRLTTPVDDATATALCAAVQTIAGRDDRPRPSEGADVRIEVSFPGGRVAVEL